MFSIMNFFAYKNWLKLKQKWNSIDLQIMIERRTKKIIRPKLIGTEKKNLMPIYAEY